MGTQAYSMLEGHHTCCFHLYFRDLHRCILPLGFDLSHNRTGILSMFNRWLQVYQRPVFRSKHRCSACPTYKAKQQLIRYLCFSTSQLQVTRLCLQFSLPIFTILPHFSTPLGISYSFTKVMWKNNEGIISPLLTLFCEEGA